MDSMTDIRTAYQALPGKAGKGNTFLPLWIHLKDTVAVIDYLCKKRITVSMIRAAGLNREMLRSVCIFFAGVHDMGKCTPGFTDKILPSIPTIRERLCHYGINLPDKPDFGSKMSIPHALAGEILLRGFNCPDGICAVVGAHHGKPSDCIDETKDAEAYPLSYYSSCCPEKQKLWKKMQECLLQDALKESGFSSVEKLPVLSNCAQMLLCGLLIQADWIASNESYFPLLSEDDEWTITMYPERVREALEKISLPEVWHAHVETNDGEAFFMNRFGFAPNAMQRAVISAAQKASDNGGLLIIEAQMGIGKTEAALAAAEILAQKSGCGGVFFGLPTQATSNGLFPRMTRWVKCVSRDGTHAIRLVHGMAELNEDYQAFRGKATVEEDGGQSNQLTVHSWFSGKKQALLADFVVGTVDTALMAALKQKHVMLRHLGLCGKVVIIDECHAYDAYMSRFLICMLQWLGGYRVPVILLSATLPEEKKREMVQAYCRPYDDKRKRDKLSVPAKDGYPLLTWAAGENIQSIPIEEATSEVTVTMESLAEIQLTETLRTRMSDGGCVGIIVNTVKRAQAFADRLRRQFPDKRIYVYHAQFIAEERIRRECELMTMIGKSSDSALRDNVIVIGTQVLEQSLDIDFDYLITDLCPMDLLLQRMGRLHRHQRVRPSSLSHPICTVLDTDEKLEEGSERIYGEWLLMQTRQQLQDLPQEICLPRDIPKLVNAVYTKKDDNDQACNKFHDHEENKNSKASDWCLPHPKNSKYEQSNSIVGLLQINLENDKMAEATVRDGLPSIDVLVMCRREEAHIGFLPWISDKLLRMDATPSKEEARNVARQKLRLPFVFGMKENLEKVINDLEEENKQWLSQWQESPWIKGELILLLDENGERMLCDYHLHYDKEDGLRYERTGE